MHLHHIFALVTLFTSGWVFINIGPAIVSAVIGHKKGYGGVASFFLGFLLNIPGCIIMYLLPIKTWERTVPPRPLA